MDIIGVKVLSGFLFFFIALTFGCLPFFVFWRCLPTNSKTQNPGRSTLVHCLHALASGVLIATCLLHLLPESLENVQDALALRQELAGQDLAHDKNGSNADSGNSFQDHGFDWSLYPVAELLVAAGFLAVYMIDTTMKSVQKNGHIHGEVKYSRLKTHDVEDDDEVEIYAQSLKHTSNGKTQKRKMPQHQDNYDPFSETKDEVDSEGDKMASHDNNHGSGNFVPSQTTSDFVSLKHHDTIADSVSEQNRSGHVRSIALVIALCIHGFFDGVMLGLQTSISVLYSLILALSLHKSFVATSLSITLLKNHSSTTSLLRVVVYVLLFAFVAPLGLTASATFVQSGLFASQENGEVGVAPGCIQAFAVGTFLYVTFTEVTGRHDEKRSLKLELLCHIFLLTGFAFMALMRLTFSE